MALRANFWRLKAKKQPQTNGLIITRFPLSFHCQFDTLFRHHTGHLLLKWRGSSVCNHPLKGKKRAIEQNILQFWWWCGGRERGSAPCFEVQVADVLIGVRLPPPLAIKSQRLHRSHYLLDSKHLSLWCGVIKSSQGLRGLLAISEWNLPAFV